MHFKVPHKTTKADAMTKIRLALRDAKPHLPADASIDEERWEGSTLHFAATLQGKKITGHVEITDSEMIIDAKLPLMWRLFEGRIEKMIAQQIQQMT